MTYRIQLDIVTENNDIAATLNEMAATLKEMRADHEFSARVINPAGPGGGWPVVEFTAEGSSMIQLLWSYSGYDMREFHHLIDQLKVV